MTKKVLVMGLACMILFATEVVVAQGKKEMGNRSRPNMEQIMQRQKEAMTKRYAGMDKEKLSKSKDMLQKRVETAKNERQKQRIQMELEIIDSLLNK